MKFLHVARRPPNRSIRDLAIPRYRRGVTLLEGVVSSALLASLLTITLQVVGALKQGEQESLRHLDVTTALENALEDLTALPWDDLNPTALAQVKLPAHLGARWPEARLNASLAIEETPPAKRVTVRFVDPHRPSPPIHSLTGWVVRPVGESP